MYDFINLVTDLRNSAFMTVSTPDMQLLYGITIIFIRINFGKSWNAILRTLGRDY